MKTVRLSALVIGLLHVPLLTCASTVVLADPSETAKVTSITSSGPTDTFIDAAAKGKDPSAFAGKWIRFTTKENPDGFLTRVKSFDPATGEFVLDNAIPAGLVRVNDTYRLAASQDELPAGNDAVTVPAGEEKSVTDVGFKTKATATAIGVGAGSDNVLNLGGVVAEARSTVVPFVTPAESSSAPSADQNEENNGESEKDKEIKPTTSEATATGIDLDAGNNAARNAGTLTTTAASRVLEGSIPTQLDEAKDVDVSATATARSTAARAGDGADSVTSTGAITSESTAAAAGVGVTVGAPATANSASDTNGSDDDPKKQGVTVKANVTVTTEASGIVAGAGDDVVTNKAQLATTASSTSAAVEGGVAEVKGSAAVTAASTADAAATAIDAGAGKNTIINTGAIETTATATATARSIDISTSPAKPAAAESGNADTNEEKEEETAKAAVNASATATARAVGIKDADETKSTSNDLTPSISSGVLSVKGDSHETRESGETSVDNDAAITVGATATTKAASAGAKAGGEASVDATSTAESTAVAIDLGGGADALSNRNGGTLKATVTATANALSLALGIQTGSESTTPQSTAASDENDESKDSSAKSVVAANATATATASGVLADGSDSDRLTSQQGSIGGGAVRLRREEQTTNANGDDTLSNAATIEAAATAATTANGIGLTIGGETSAEVKSTATAAATGIDLGAGRDTLTNAATGELSASAASIANALGISVAAGAAGGKQSPAPSASAAADAEPPGEEKPGETTKDTIKSAVDAGAVASSTAKAVSADGGPANQLNVDSLTLDGGVFEVRRERTTTSAGGDDTVENAATLSATATATSASTGLAVTLGGEASADVTSQATAAAVGIDLGAGADRLVNSANAPLTASATATAEAVGLAVGFADEPTTPQEAKAATDDTDGKDGKDDKDASSANSTVDASAAARATAAGIAADGRERESSQLTSLRIGDGTFALVYERTSTNTGGRDDVKNSAVVDSTATATSAAGDVGASFGGEPSAKVRSTADARSTAIDLGGGDDTLENAMGATLTVTATATARALAAALGVKTDTKTPQPSTAADVNNDNDHNGNSDDNTDAEKEKEPSPTPSKSAVDASVTSRAEATGISADGGEQETSRKAQLTIGNGRLRLFGEDLVKAASGSDHVTNSAAITTNATATAPAVATGVTVGGDAASQASSTAEAIATGISLGGGDDTVTNNPGGTVVATSNATAVAVGLAVGVTSDDSSGNGAIKMAASETPAPPETPKPAPLKSAVDATAAATSRSVGIAADGLAQTAMTLDATITTSSVKLAIEHTKVQARGNDTVRNDAAITATATATAPAVGVGVTIGGGSAAKVNSKAESEAVGIEAGGGNDTVTNNGTLVADASATALGVNVAISTSGEQSDEKTKSAVDGSASAVARAAGLAGDSLTGDATTRGSLSIDAAGVKIGFENSVTNVSGDDNLTNAGAVSATATARSTGIGAAFTVKGRAAANTRSAAEAVANAIDLGSGVDKVDNSGMLTASSTAATEALKVAVTSEGNATASDGLWRAGIKSESRASGISAAGQEASTTTLDIDLGASGATARFVEAKDTTVTAGADDITNRGDVTATATADARSTNVAATGEGKAAVVTHAEGKADAAGIRTGGGNDTIRNLNRSDLVDALMTVNATAAANSGSVSVSGKGVAVAADALWDGGTKAQAIAAGIDSDNGRIESREITLTTMDGVTVERIKKDTGVSSADTIVNEQTIDVMANANSPGFAVSLQAEKGLAATVSSVESEAVARAIRAGGGDDDIVNRGTLDARATTVAETANVAISKSGAAIATGSVWDGGTKATATAAGIDADGGPADTVDTVKLNIGDGGVTITKFKSESEAGGRDHVDNLGGVTATADAVARSLDVALTTKGLSAALSQSTATALADAIRGGDGDDDLRNRGRLLADASASAAAASVSVSTEKGVVVAGNAVWDGGVTAEATATGLSGDGGVRSATTTTTIGVKKNGGIDTVKTSVAASGDDFIANSGEIEVRASATAPAVSVAIGVTGVGAAVSTSTANASAAAIDGGGGNDVIASSGKLIADATSLAVAVNGSGVGKGVAIAANDSWDGGTEATAHARGIAAGSGSDHVTSDGAIVTTATATAASATGAVAVQGVAAAVSTGTATSTASAIDTADQDDIVANSGKLAATAISRAGTVNVSVTTAGLAAAGDKAWDGGTAADANARGISAGDGVDRVTNDGEIEARSDAKTTSIAVSVAVNGVAGSVATSTATAASAAIDAGADNDVLINQIGSNPSRTGKLTAAAAAFASAALRERRREWRRGGSGQLLGRRNHRRREGGRNRRRFGNRHHREWRNDQRERRRQHGVGRGQRRCDRRRRGRAGGVDRLVECLRHRRERDPAGFDLERRPSEHDLRCPGRVCGDRIQHLRRRVCRKSDLGWRDARGSPDQRHRRRCGRRYGRQYGRHRDRVVRKLRLVQRQHDGGRCRGRTVEGDDHCASDRDRRSGRERRRRERRYRDDQCEGRCDRRQHRPHHHRHRGRRLD